MLGGVNQKRDHADVRINKGKDYVRKERWAITYWTASGVTCDGRSTLSTVFKDKVLEQMRCDNLWVRKEETYGITVVQSRVRTWVSATASATKSVPLQAVAK